MSDPIAAGATETMPQTRSPLLQLRDVSVSFNGREVVHGVDLDRKSVV